MMSDGRWTIGVFETPTGYAAGTFIDNERQDTDDRNVLIHAFDLGAQAATALAADFARKGNTASAAHYRDMADKLAGQMD
jgi:hypothetical protein